MTGLKETFMRFTKLALALGLSGLLATTTAEAQRTVKPVLHGPPLGRHYGKPLAATAGARMFHKGGNAVDSAAAMLAATSTMWDVLSWGGETQALIYNPSPQGDRDQRSRRCANRRHARLLSLEEHAIPLPEYGPLSAVTPGTPGGLMVMRAEYGTMSLAEVLAPAIEMADGYTDRAAGREDINEPETKAEIVKWPSSRAVFFTRGPNEGPKAGDIFRQPDLAATLRKLVEAEAQALKAGKSRREAIMAANDRFYRGDIAAELVRGTRELGGLFTAADLANWRVRTEEPVSVNYKGVTSSSCASGRRVLPCSRP
jgi:gamma-glutamyltranspeptidase/glutathione hydrolase